MEKALLHLWPYVNGFEEIREKYGRKIEISIYHDEQWAIIESLSHDVVIADVLKEYNIKDKRHLLQDYEIAQIKARPK